jgi:predicted nucleic acid-binding protein
MTKYLVDTNVCLRIATPDSAQHDSGKLAVAKLISRGDEIYVAPQVIAEFWVTATRPKTVNGLGWPPETAELEVARVLDRYPVLSETTQLFPEWHRLVIRHRVIGKQAHDTRLVAIMNTNGLTHILTFNVNNFRAYNVTVVSPDDVLAS